MDRHILPEQCKVTPDEHLPDEHHRHAGAGRSQPSFYARNPLLLPSGASWSCARFGGCLGLAIHLLPLWVRVGDIGARPCLHRVSVQHEPRAVLAQEEGGDSSTAAAWTHSSPAASSLLPAVGEHALGLFRPKSFSRRRSIARVGAGILRGACILPQLPRWHLAEEKMASFVLSPACSSPAKTKV